MGITAYTVRPPEAPRDKPVISHFVEAELDGILAALRDQAPAERGQLLRRAHALLPALRAVADAPRSRARERILSRGAHLRVARLAVGLDE